MAYVLIHNKDYKSVLSQSALTILCWVTGVSYHSARFPLTHLSLLHMQSRPIRIWGPFFVPFTLASLASCLPSTRSHTLDTRGFSRAARIFGVGRSHETGNRARKVSGTLGNRARESRWNQGLMSTPPRPHSTRYHCTFLKLWLRHGKSWHLRWI